MSPKRRKPLLSHTRPPHSTSKRLSSPQTRHLIRTHHTLQKRLSAALAANDTALIATLQTQIVARGGLALYQRASMLGQSAERGGDSGTVLRKWVEEDFGEVTVREEGGKENFRGEKVAYHGRRVRMLEVGALRIDNACSRSALFAVERIDLQSQHPEIRTQDFIQRPLPTTAAEQFDIVGLSLVLNFVGTPMGRGEMLQRAEQFLRRADPVAQHDIGVPGAEKSERLAPGIFLVLPAPCVLNSRYLDEQRLEDMMRSLGYVRARRKMSAKLVYYFWRFVGRGDGGLGGVGMEDKALKRTAASGFRTSFKKEEIRPGGKRNNFAIVLA